jgi:hypothetical protein
MSSFSKRLTDQAINDVIDEIASATRYLTILSQLFEAAHEDLVLSGNASHGLVQILQQVEEQLTDAKNILEYGEKSTDAQ